jgi:hypothetical protein
MAEVVLFRSRAERSAEANLRDFIALCRDRLTVFGAELRFDQLVWDVTEAIALKGKGGASRVVFSTWDSAGTDDPKAMAEPFCSFAKAYFRYQHGARPTKSIGARVAALRALERALTESGDAAHPCRIHAGIADRAAQLIKDRFAPAVAYCVGGQMEMVARFLSDHRLTSMPASWHNPLKRPTSVLDRVGEEFDRRRQEKLPSPTALEALATAFRAARKPADVVVCSVAAVLCSAPERINEVLLLRTDCEVTAEHSGENAYGLRWWPSKGAQPQVKWIIPSMADVVRLAIANIREHTEEARRIARWYESHPGSIYISRDVSHLRTCEWLSMEDVNQILFADPASRKTACQWCNQNRIALVKRSGRLFASFAAVEAAVLRKLPRGFPVLNIESALKYSDALCVIRRNALHDSNPPYRCMIEPVSHHDIHDRLGNRSAAGVRSVFDRLGLSESDGRPIRIRTHQFRHYLNTLAQAGGMSQLDIAKWSGRADIRQNAAYDHTSDESVLLMLREAVGDPSRMRGPLATLPHGVPIARDEIARRAIPAVHTTEVGFCVHDFVMSPCRLHRDCFHCQELICIKGDLAKEAEIRRLRTETQDLLALALKAAGKQATGTNRWIDHHQHTLKRLEQLCSILDDPAVPAGTFIHLAPPKVPPQLPPASRGRALEQMTDSPRELS